MAAKLPPKYTGAVVLGSNISGTFASIISIVSGSMSSSPRKAAIYYFIAAMFVILLCFDTYFAMPLNKFYRYHEMMSEKREEKARRSGINVKARPPYWTIFKQSFGQLFNVFFIFFVTLTVFPAIHSDIRQVSDGKFLGIVPQNLFVQITCFLTFNVFAMLGSLTTSWIKWVRKFTRLNRSNFQKPFSFSAFSQISGLACVASCRLHPFLLILQLSSDGIRTSSSHLYHERLRLLGRCYCYELQLWLLKLIGNDVCSWISDQSSIPNHCRDDGSSYAYHRHFLGNFLLFPDSTIC